eukprot:SAG11_NODE_11980_length_728_cov_0.675676_1_plen_173_part_10
MQRRPWLICAGCHLVLGTCLTVSASELQASSGTRTSCVNRVLNSWRANFQTACGGTTMTCTDVCRSSLETEFRGCPRALSALSSQQSQFVTSTCGISSLTPDFRTVAATGQCLSTSTLDIVNDVCCHGQCNALPQQCSPECANVFVPYFLACAGTGLGTDAALNAFYTKCGGG